MNPYLLQLAKEHQAELLCDAETRNQLKATRTGDEHAIHRKNFPSFLVTLIINILLGFFGKHGRMMN